MPKIVTYEHESQDIRDMSHNLQKKTHNFEEVEKTKNKIIIRFIIIITSLVIIINAYFAIKSFIEELKTESINFKKTLNIEDYINSNNVNQNNSKINNGISSNTQNDNILKISPGFDPNDLSLTISIDESSIKNEYNPGGIISMRWFYTGDINHEVSVELRRFEEGKYFPGISIFQNQKILFSKGARVIIPKNIDEGNYYIYTCIGKDCLTETSGYYPSSFSKIFKINMLEDKNAEINNINLKNIDNAQADLDIKKEIIKTEESCNDTIFYGGNTWKLCDEPGEYTLDEAVEACSGVYILPSIYNYEHGISVTGSGELFADAIKLKKSTNNFDGMVMYWTSTKYEKENYIPKDGWANSFGGMNYEIWGSVITQKYRVRCIKK